MNVAVLLEQEGWDVKGGTVSQNISLEDGTGLNLAVEFVILYTGGVKNYIITGWRQWQDQFEFESGGLQIWSGE